MEMSVAFYLHKKLFLLNNIPEWLQRIDYWDENDNHKSGFEKDKLKKNHRYYSPLILIIYFLYTSAIASTVVLGRTIVSDFSVIPNLFALSFSYFRILIVTDSKLGSPSRTLITTADPSDLAISSASWLIHPRW